MDFVKKTDPITRPAQQGLTVEETFCISSQLSLFKNFLESQKRSLPLSFPIR